MKTRNQIKQEEAKRIAEFTPKFFEESSKAWLANKEKYGQNMYRYKREAFQEPLSSDKRSKEPVPRRSKRLQEQQER